MGWYDFFSRFYDRSLERLYVDARAAAVRGLELSEGQVVLDLPCGTGQSFDGLVAGVGAEGEIIGIDLSRGMLARAEERVAERGLGQVRLVQADVMTLDAETLDVGGTRRPVDRLHVFLGMSAFPDPGLAFERLWALLRPGGRCVIVDVHDPSPGLQGRMVNLVAGAQIQRRSWEPLEAVAEDYAFEELPSLRQHGGQLFMASGNKPR